MPPIEVLFTFFITAVLLALAPGPDNLYVLAQSVLRGRRAGLTVMAGLCTGLVGHTLAVAFGLAAIFQTSEAAFTVVKLLGAAYLGYLAWQAFRAQPGEISTASAQPPGARGLYLRGILMNLSNPKVSLFFLAFLPQFTDPGRGPVAAQMLLLGALFILATLLVFGSVAMFSGPVARRISASPTFERTMNRIVGTVFVALAVKLVTARP